MNPKTKTNAEAQTTPKAQTTSKAKTAPKEALGGSPSAAEIASLALNFYAGARTSDYQEAAREAARIYVAAETVALALRNRAPDFPTGCLPYELGETTDDYYSLWDSYVGVGSVGKRLGERRSNSEVQDWISINSGNKRDANMSYEELVSAICDFRADLIGMFMMPEKKEQKDLEGASHADIVKWASRNRPEIIADTSPTSAVLRF